MLSLTRLQLYDLVWTTPKHQLPAQLGLSDVAIAKRCRKLNIPIPPRGYWAKVHAGQTPKRPPLPKREDQHADFRLLSFHEGKAKVAASPDDNAWSQRIAALDISPLSDISDTHLIVRRTALAIKHAGAASLALPRTETTGCIVDITVTEASRDRALKLADQLLRTGIALGWEFTAPRPEPKPPEPRYSYYNQKPNPPPPPPKHWPGHFVIAGENVALRIEERMDELHRTPTPAELTREKRDYRYRASRTTQIPTGKLRVVRIDPTAWGSGRRSWYDRGSTRVETHLPEILQAFQQLGEEKRADRLEREERARLEQIEEKRAEALRQRREANATRIVHIERLVGAWQHARLIRQFHRALVKAHPAEANSTSWMTDYANQVDPLHPVTRDPDWEPNDNPYYRQDEVDLKVSLARLIGQAWFKVEKVADWIKAPTPNDVTPDG